MNSTVKTERSKLRSIEKFGKKFDNALEVGDYIYNEEETIRRVVDADFQSKEDYLKAGLFEDNPTKFENDETKAITSVMMHNLMQQDEVQKAAATERLYESVGYTSSDALALYNRFSLGIARELVPNLNALQMLTTQPMLGPTSLVFYYDLVYADSKGNVTAGETLFRKANTPYYSSETVKDEPLATGDGSTKAYTFSLKWTPLNANKLTLYVDGTAVGADDGSGGITGSGVSTGTVNYDTGQVNVTFSTAPASNAAVTATYQYDMEHNSQRPRIRFKLTQELVEANERALIAEWPFSAAANLKSVHGLNTQANLMSGLVTEIRREIDSEASAKIDALAIDGSSHGLDDWYRYPPKSTGRYQPWIESLVQKFNKANQILTDESTRGTGTFIKMGTDVSSVVQSIGAPRFVASNIRSRRGVTFVGRLDDKWDIFVDPDMTGTEYVVGYKSDNFLDAGLAFLPYIPLLASSVIETAAFQNSQGLMTMYAFHEVFSNYYVKGNIVLDNAVE